jgi:hypothetical protein
MPTYKLSDSRELAAVSNGDLLCTLFNMKIDPSSG